MSDLRDKLDAIADGSPAPTGAQRDREIQSAVTRGLATPAREARRMWPWVIAPIVAAAAAIAIWLGMRGDDAGTEVASAGDAGAMGDAGTQVAMGDASAMGDVGANDPTANGAQGDLVVERGVDAPVGTLVESPEITVLRSGGTRIEANAKTKFARETRDASRWRLEHGQLALRVADKTTLEVTTPEARVVVVGSQFIVGRYASETIVEVLVGDVLVTPTDGEPVTVHAGERWPAEPTPIADAGVANDSPRDAGVARDAGVRVPVLQFDATIIRKTIRAGKVGDAREMIEAQRSAHASSKRALAELGILAAEADLAERKTKSAIAKYLDVVRDYSSTPQAEQALFAAAQLAIDRPDAGYKPEALLKDYLATYPKGQFVKDAQRLLDTMKK